MMVVTRSRTFLHALAFVLGFSAVFVFLGASVAFIGYGINAYLPMIERIGGVFLIIFGLQVAGVLGWMADKIRSAGGGRNFIGRSYLAFESGLSQLMYTEGRVKVQSDRRWGYLSSAMMGVFFSAGWIPCVGPVLAAIYLLASDTQTVAQGALLLLVYSAGLGLPFLVTGAALSSITPWMRRMNRHLGIIAKVTGIFLMGLGLLLAMERMTLINSMLVSRFGTGLASLDLGANGAAIVTLPIAFAAGLLSFLSPCVFPVIPGYIGYLSGTAIVAGGAAVAATKVVSGASAPAGSAAAKPDSRPSGSAGPAR
jgi:cytochrome c-type biogenesis protein